MSDRGDWLVGFRGDAARPQAVQIALNNFQRFVHSQVLGSIVLIVCALLAIIWANSPWSASYFHLWETELAFTLGETTFSLTLHQWLNEALMMSFFLLIGLEVKEQVLVGELSSVRQAMLPVGAALGGMIVPALLYTMLNGGGAGAAGWGVPMSTDIAFALGILALLGRRVPLSLKVFLATLAVADDIGAILVITFFYTGNIEVGGLVLAVGFWLVLYVLSRLGIYNAHIYFGLSIGVWFGFFLGGIHATIAGVVVAMAIPARTLVDPSGLVKRFNELDFAHMRGHDVLRDHEQKDAVNELHDAVKDVTPPLVKLEHSLEPLVTFVVMPLFALANAGVVIGGNPGETVTSSVSLGIILGLFVGKPLGITLFTWLAVRSGLAQLPKRLTWGHIRAVSWLAGIGFTMSLFVTELAFAGQPVLSDEAKIGILVASFISGVVGYVLLHQVTRQHPTPESGYSKASASL